MPSARPSILLLASLGLAAPALGEGVHLHNAPEAGQEVSVQFQFELAEHPGAPMLIGILLAILLTFIAIALYCYRLRPAGNPRPAGLAAAPARKPAARRTLSPMTARHLLPRTVTHSHKSPPLPPALQAPHPADFESAPPVSLAEQERIVDLVCRVEPGFARICRLFRDEHNWVERENFIHEAAEAYLQHFGMPQGGLEPSSRLIHAGAGERFWFVGDIHGSLDSLLRLYAYIRHEGITGGVSTQHLVLLGDLIDRGEHSLCTLAFIQHLLTNPHPGLRITVLRGNHDDGLFEEGGRFDSIVEPAESIEEFDCLLESGEPKLRETARLMGRAAIRLAELSPVMAEITGLDPTHPERTLLCTHGGLPHTDLQAALARAEKGQQGQPAAGKPYLDSIPAALRAAFALDYTWIRLLGKSTRKAPNRKYPGCRMGTRDVDDYRLQHWKRSGRAIGFIIHGHNHEPAGWALLSHDARHNPTRSKHVHRHCGILTINAMDPDTSSGGIFMRRNIGLASCRAGGPLCLTPLKGYPPGMPD